VTVRDSDGTPLVNLPVYAFNGSTYVNVSAITDANGQVFLTLVDGNYRFQTELNGVQFWSDNVNHCTLPGCTGAEIEVTKPLTVSVTDTQGTAQAGLTVRIYDGETYTGYSGTTDVNGQVSLTLPAGNYRARVDYNEAKFYSSATNTCTLPGCEQISVTVNVPVTVSVVGVDNSPFEGITVELYKDGVLQTNDDLTDENGAVLFTLNDDVYQFAANLSETRFWSETCTIPGCTEQEIVLPGGQGGIQETIISYEYDDLYRLTEANYDNGLYFHYSYDAAGNRLTETTQNSSTSYVYDVGNRLSSVDGVAYTWDNNGNLLSDGASTYSYDYNNKLVGLSQGTDVYQYVYNGLGDRVQQIVNGVTTDYVLDINTGLTQVLQDGTNTYLYGVNRIAQSTTTETEYFLADALGSVRNLTDGIGNITLTQSYSPFGEVLTSTGEGQTDYAFTGEMFDPTTGLVYLRARYYGVNDGRFVSRDSWNGASVYPISYNKWGYSFDNPLVFFDPSGNKPTTRWPLANFTDTRHKIDSTNSIVQKFREERSWDWASMKRMHDDMWDVANAYADAYNRYVITHNRNLLNKYRPMIKHWEYLYASEKNCYGYINFVDFINPLVAFWKIHKGAMNIERVDGEAGTAWGESQSPNNIHIFDTLTSAKAAQTPRFIVHEIGHSFENAMADTTGRKEAYYPSDWPAVENRGQPFIQQNKWGRQGLSPFPELYNYRGDGVENFAGFHGKYLVWQFSKDIGGLVGNTDGRGEIFADMFIGWVYNKWEADPDFLSGLTYLGEQRKEYMDTQMDKWIFDIIQIRSGKVSVPYVENGRFVWKYQK
jgi:RHS repeat-associated protein